MNTKRMIGDSACVLVHCMFISNIVHMLAMACIFLLCTCIGVYMYMYIALSPLKSFMYIYSMYMYM